MILLLDNYDSFTYNLAQYLGELGCEVEVHRNDKISVERNCATQAGSHRDFAGSVHAARGRNFRGVDRAAGGEISDSGRLPGASSDRRGFWREDKTCAGTVSRQDQRNSSRRQGCFPRSWPNHFTATRYHSLIVERKTLPRELTITAETDDGIIMGLRHKRLQNRRGAISSGVGAYGIRQAIVEEFSFNVSENSSKGVHRSSKSKYTPNKFTR